MGPPSYSEIKTEKNYFNFFECYTKKRSCARLCDIGKRKLKYKKYFINSILYKTVKSQRTNMNIYI